MDLTSYFQCLFLVLSFLLVVRVSLAYQRLDIANGSMLQTISLLLDQQVCCVLSSPTIRCSPHPTVRSPRKLDHRSCCFLITYYNPSCIVHFLMTRDKSQTFASYV